MSELRNNIVLSGVLGIGNGGTEADTAQEAIEKRIVEQFKEKKIDIRTYKESIKRLDFAFDILSIRKNIFGEQDKKEGPFKYLGSLGKIKKDG